MTRISDLPWRDWTVDAEANAAWMTDWLKTRNGTWSLWPVQGQALFEVLQCRGGFFALMVGSGKTIISALTPTVVDAKRPLLVVPGKMHKRSKGGSKTEREFTQLRNHWRLPPHYPIETYNRLSLEAQANFFFEYGPDCIVFDESQKLKNRDKVAVAIRLARYLEDCELKGRDVVIVFLSGSPTKDKLNDFAHLLLHALGDGTPLPQMSDVWEKWGAVVDANKDAGVHTDLGIFTRDLGKCRTVAEARKRIRDRINGTPGIIITAEPFDHPLEINALPYDLPEEVQDLYPKLRNDWLAADDFPLTDAQTEVWANGIRYAAGLQFTWDPWPPDDWREARRLYGRAIRKAIESGIGETEKQIRSLIETDVFPCQAYWEWLAIEPTFTPNGVQEVISDVALDVARKWLDEQGEGVIWVHHTLLGRHLSKKLRIPYHGSGGLDSRGKSIDQAKGPVLASLEACGEGFNLQYQYHKCLFLEHPRGAQPWEQAIGRFHRPGAKHPVQCWFSMACLEHHNAIGKALREAWFAQETLGIPQKLLQSKPKGVRLGSGPAWDPPIRKADDDE